MRTIKQPDGSQACVLACAAMLCGKSFEAMGAYLANPIFGAVKADWRSQPLGLSGLSILLALHGRLPGLMINWEPEIRLDPSRFDQLPVSCAVESHDAILSVTNGRGGRRFHAVVWDSSILRVRDPLPHLPETTDLTQYSVCQWMPITKVVDAGWAP